MDHLIRSWRQSLTMLRPRELRRFLLLSTNTARHLFMSIARYGWWAVALWLALWYSKHMLPALSDHPYFLYLHEIGYSIVTGLTGFLLSVLARSSVEQKNYSYITSKIRWALVLVPFFVLISLIFKDETGRIMSKMRTLELTEGVLFNLFFLDSYGSWRDFVNSIFNNLYMVVYNLPLIGILGLIEIALGFMIPINWLTPLIILVIAPFFIAIFACLYRKRLYDDFGLYHLP